MNNRRKLLVALCASARTASLSSFAQQQGKVRRVGFLLEAEQSYYVPLIDAFKAGMRELGYAEGRDFAIKQRSAQTDLARLPALVAELIALKVDVIVPAGTPAAVAAHNATREIPILIVTVGDPVGSGLAASLRHPGGNVTGLTGLSTELYTKRLDLLRQLLPGIRRVGLFYNPDVSSDALGLRQFETDCNKLQFNSIRAPVRKREDIVAAFTTLQRDKAQGLIVTTSATNNASIIMIIEQAAKLRLPTIYGRSYFAESGGLISYAPDSLDLFKRAAAYANKIFKGAKPGDLPIEQPTKFETVISLKTAKALGIKIPDVIMLRADKVIE
jgi:putative tryptophan/tyrosine transport system substrate-binding protein